MCAWMLKSFTCRVIQLPSVTWLWSHIVQGHWHWMSSKTFSQEPLRRKTQVISQIAQQAPTSMLMHSHSHRLELLAPWHFHFPNPPEHSENSVQVGEQNQPFLLLMFFKENLDICISFTTLLQELVFEWVGKVVQDLSVQTSFPMEFVLWREQLCDGHKSGFSKQPLYKQN